MVSTGSPSTQRITSVPSPQTVEGAEGALDTTPPREPGGSYASFIAAHFSRFMHVFTDCCRALTAPSTPSRPVRSATPGFPPEDVQPLLNVHELVYVSYAAIPPLDPRVAKRSILFGLIDQCIDEANNANIWEKIQAAIDSDPQALVAFYDVTGHGLRNLLHRIRDLETDPVAHASYIKRKNLTVKDVQQAKPEREIIYPVEYAVKEGHALVAGMLLQNMVAQASHTQDDEFRALLLEGLSAVAGLFVEYELSAWAALCANGLALGQGGEQMKQSLKRFGESDYQVAQTIYFFRDFVRQRVGANVDAPEMKDFWISASCDALMLQAAYRLAKEHSTRDIDFGTFTHGNMVLEQLKVRVAEAITESAAKDRAKTIIEIMELAIPLEQRLNQIQTTLDSSQLIINKPAASSS